VSDVAQQALSTANEAKQRIETHEDVCADRYKQILDNQKEGREDRVKLWAAMHEGFKEQRGIMVKGVFAVFSALFGIIILFIKYLLTRGV
jgi:hypothetical protein